MGLASARVKQRIGADPQNKAWKDDASKAGLKMMEKMGWRAGQGLGKGGLGSTTNVKVIKKHDNFGIGADVRTVDNWLDNTSAFADVLCNLNKKGDSFKVVDGQFVFLDGSQNNKQTLENVKMESTKETLAFGRLAHRKKFLKAKDTSKFSPTDMASILGHQSGTETTAVSTVDKSRESDQFKHSKTSTTDYFARKSMDPKLRALLESRLPSKPLETGSRVPPSDDKAFKNDQPDANVVAFTAAEYQSQSPSTLTVRKFGEEASVIEREESKRTAKGKEGRKKDKKRGNLEDGLESKKDRKRAKIKDGLERKKEKKRAKLEDGLERKKDRKREKLGNDIDRKKDKKKHSKKSL